MSASSSDESSRKGGKKRKKAAAETPSPIQANEGPNLKRTQEDFNFQQKLNKRSKFIKNEIITGMMDKGKKGQNDVSRNFGNSLQINSEPATCGMCKPDPST